MNAARAEFRRAAKEAADKEASVSAELREQEREVMMQQIQQNAGGAIVMPSIEVDCIQCIVNATTEACLTTPRTKVKRPDNWKQIAVEYMAVTASRRLVAMIRKFQLPLSDDLSPSYWTNSLNRWVRELHTVKTLQYGRMSSLDVVVERNLVKEVLRYNAYFLYIIVCNTVTPHICYCILTK